MMSTAAIMFALGFSYFIAHFFQFLFSRFRIPDVLLFMFIGLILGPVTGFVDKTSFGRTGDALSTLALVLILFDSGVNLNIKAIKESWLQIILLALISALFTGVVFYIVGLSLGLSSSLALILGAILCGTSSAVVIPMIQSLKLHPKSATICTIESAITDVLCIVLTASFINAHLSGVFSMGSITGSISLSMVGATLWGLGLGICWLYCSQYSQKLPNTTFATLAFGLLVYGTAEVMGLSGGIAIMAYGFALANGRWMIKKDFGITNLEKTIYSELIFILKTFFFIYLGTSLSFSDNKIITIASVGTLTIFILRLVIVRFTSSRSLPLRDRSYMTLLIPKGLAAAVLASIPVQKGIEGGEELQLIVYSVVFVSIILCAVFTPFMEIPKISLLMGRLLGTEEKE